jgi:hypothetical protein
MSATALDRELSQRLAEVCRKFDVETLEVFGSFATGVNFNDESDVDFLVEFVEGSDLDPVDKYFGLKDELEKLFCRSVDLVSVKVVRNPYFLREASRSRRLVYERQN